VNGDATTPSWYYAKTGAVDGQQVGPVSWEQLVSLAQTGALTASDLVWNPEYPSWVTVAEVPGLLAPPLPEVEETPEESAVPPAIPPAGARPGAIQPTARQAARPSAGYDPFLDEGEPSDFGSQRPWLRWGLIIGAVAVIGIILGVYFGVIRGGTEPTTTLAPTTTVIETTTSDTEPPLPVAMWTDLAPGGELPDSRSEHAAAYDTINGVVVLFGGWNSSNETFNDTWKFDATTDTWTNAAPTGTLPASRAQHQMVYDGINGQLIMFGGILKTDGDQLNDTWAYDATANTWTELKPTGAVPSTRSSFAMVYDDLEQKTILFGGWSEATSAHLNDVWVYDYLANTWTSVTSTGAAPPARGGHAMAYDPVQDKIVLFGGTDSSTYFNDTWVFDFTTSTWTQVTPMGDMPSPRSGHRMAYDPTTATVVLFGGWDGTAYFNDTWTFDVATSTWTVVDLMSAPAARDSHSLVCSLATNELILFGGFVGGTDAAQDTWAYGEMDEIFTNDTIVDVDTSVIAGTTTTLGP